MSYLSCLRRSTMLLAFTFVVNGTPAHATAQPATAQPTAQQAATQAAVTAAAPSAAPAAATATTTATGTPAPAAAPATSAVPPAEQIKALTSQLDSLNSSHKTFLDDLSRCANIPERVMRIQCYDELSTESGFMTRAKKEEQEKIIDKIGFWQVVVSEDKMGEQTMYLKLYANDIIRTGAATEKKPELVLRCYRKNTEVYLDWKSLLTENRAYIKSIYVTSRFDSENAMQKDWQLSLDKNAAFAPDTINFVRQMKEHGVLTLELTPYNMSSTTLAFTLNNFDKALEILVKRCYN